jgi:transcriptional regulator with XRE-family HTH domain
VKQTRTNFSSHTHFKPRHAPSVLVRAADQETTLRYGHAIKMARTARALTQRELAERLGVASSYVSLLEAGKRRPSLDVLERVCAALDFPMQLIVLMASSSGELRGINEEEAKALSGILLRILTEEVSEDEGGRD